MGEDTFKSKFRITLTPSHAGQGSEVVEEFGAILKPDGAIEFLDTPQTEQSMDNPLAERGYIV